jgi:hypothetical protein
MLFLTHNPLIMKYATKSDARLSRKEQQQITGGGTSGTPCCILRSSGGQTVVPNCRCSNYTVSGGATCKDGIIIVDIVMGYIIIEDQIVL